jgi:hypothetical protein
MPTSLANSSPQVTSSDWNTGLTLSSLTAAALNRLGKQVAILRPIARGKKRVNYAA